MRFRPVVVLCLVMLLLVVGCAGAQTPIKPVAHVDLPRYMGRWYVIGSIPTRFERNGFNPVESYCLTPEGEVDTSFRFRPGGFDAPLKQIHSTASVVDGSGNAVWSVRVFGFLHAQYIVAWLSPAYDQVIVARDHRDYLWLMARTPQITESEYRRLIERARALGYDATQIANAPQRWPEAVTQDGNREGRTCAGDGG